MNRHQNPAALRAVTLAIIAFTAAPSARAVISYTETSFGTIGTGESYVTGINNQGEIIGSFQSAAYQYGVFAGSIAAGVAFQPALSAVGYNTSGQLNNLGQGIGYSSGVPGTGGEVRAMLWQSGSVTDLTSGGLAGISSALGINDSGHIVGKSIDYPTNSTKGYLWANGVMQVIDPSKGAANSDVDLVGINNSDQIIGTWTDASRASHSFLRQADGSMVSLDFTPTGLNNLGQIVGYETNAQGTTGVIWQAGAGRHDIAFISSFFVPPHLSINDNGQIAGQDLARNAAVFTPGGTLLWVGLPGGRFSDAANWDSGSYFPSPNLDVAMVPNASALSAVADADATMRNLAIGVSGGYEATLSLAGATLTTQQDLTIGAHGVLSGSGRIVANGVIDNAGRIDATDLTLQGQFNNQGTVTGNGRLVADIVNMGTLSVGAGQALAVSGVAHTNGGWLQVQGGAVSIAGLLTNQIDTGNAYYAGHIDVGNGGRLTLLDGLQSNSYVAVTSGGTMDAHGAVTLGQLSIAGQGRWTGDAAVTAKGSIVIQAGGSFAANAFTFTAGTLTVDGSLDTGAGVTTRITGGVLNGNGLINGDIFFGGDSTTASFKPGHSPGHFTVNGAITLGDNSELELQVEREADGTLAWDHVSGSSISFVDGSTVHFIVGSGVAGSSLQTLSFLDCGSSCSFSSQMNWVIDGAPGSTIAFGSNGLSLSIAAVQAVPEPATWALWLAGLGLLVREARWPRGAAIRRSGGRAGSA